MLCFCTFLHSLRVVWGAMTLQVGRRLPPAHHPHSPRLTPGFGWRDREAAPSLPRCCPLPPLESSLMDPWTCIEGIICWFLSACDQTCILWSAVLQQLASLSEKLCASFCHYLPQFTALTIRPTSPATICEGYTGGILVLFLLPESVTVAAEVVFAALSCCCCFVF